VVQVIHAIPGRARFAVTGLYRSRSLKRFLEKQLARPDAIKSVTANIHTGNVLVTFEPDWSLADVVTHLEKLCFQFQQQYEAATQPRPQRQQRRDRQAEQGADQPVKDWHRLEIDAVAAEFGTDRQSGLSAEQAAGQQAQYGPNQLSESQPRSDLSILLEQFQSVPVALLGGASVLSVATGGLIDAVVILGVVGINAIVGFLTESQSEHIIQSLQVGGERTAQVRRDGQPATVDIEEIVPGDVLLLETGNVIAADGRLTLANNLSINESSLTGESIPVSKQVEGIPEDNLPLADRHNMAYRGTVVTGGRGEAIVVATGRFTEIGKIQAMVSTAEAEATPLQQQLDEVGTQLAGISSAICAGVFGIGWLRGYGLLEMLKISISLAVAAVPEGLPTIATTTLALGMQDMRQRHILIRGLAAVDALGSIQTICLDKTGTLTQNQMVVKQVRIGQDCFQVQQGQFTREDGEVIVADSIEELQRLIQVGVLCSETEYQTEEDGDYTLEGSSTENALVHLGINMGIDVPNFRDRFPCVATHLRSKDRNVMSTVHSLDDGQQLVAVKGSPEEVLERCRSWMCEGEIRPLEAEQRRRFDLDNERMAGQALRVLGVAYKQMATDQTDPESDLIWLGLTGMADPIRDGVQKFIQGFHQAGIKTVMITGDQSPTAYAIAKDLQLSRHAQIEILDAADLSSLDPEKRQALFDKVDVFARVSPVSKLEIVQALQASGQVVAMTGDGINDMPALKAADVGVAMGSGGSDVVQDVADMIIADNNLETLINAVSQGRTTYRNIRKSVHFLLSTNLGEIIVTTIATTLGLGEPLNTMKLLWLNLVTDIFPGLALALEPPEPDILDQPPRDPDEPILRRSDFSRIALESSTISLCALGAYSYSLLRYGQGPQASTTLFMSLTIGQVLHTWSCRSETHSIFDRGKMPSNPYVEGAIALSLALQILPMAFPPLRNLLQLAILDPMDWGVVLGTALLALMINESTKKGEFPVQRKRHDHPDPEDDHREALEPQAQGATA
jgi:Ca2+-transporting ATPase